MSFCDQCGRDTLDPVYKAARSTRGLTVHLCRHCGLVQSLPRIDRTETRHAMAVSCGADWGNVRYGKGFRTQNALDALKPFVSFDGPLSLLDVGSNRGRFASAFLDAAPNAALTAVEPDERFAASCASLPRTKLVNARIEDTALADAGFDIVHSCHTIEHVAHPFAVLKEHARVLKPNGLLVIDAPNIALIGSDDILEEWFIDKHLYHFSAVTLARMIETAGFTIIAHPDAGDAINLLYVARKGGGASDEDMADPAEAAHGAALLARYQANRAANLAALVYAAGEIDALCKTRRVALWGAGRLFDSLVLAGGFDPGRLTLLIDRELAGLMDARHGAALFRPQALSETPVDAIVVMSRGFAAEIAAEARRLSPDAQFFIYADLLARARLAMAA
jgi:2-polyprenyl-3-methyl-5-hydroxy-6-metoxy-1,4-benzoquinol methylase